jgi:NTE family protein
LILQGGGSLGAFACGVCKTFAKKEIKFDIISGTSIGAINGAIMAGSKNDNAAKDLEAFWMELSESSYNIIHDMFSYEYDYKKHRLNWKQTSSASLNAATFGVPKFFVPRWFNWNMFPTNDFNIFPLQWTYVYDITPLTKTRKIHRL